MKTNHFFQELQASIAELQTTLWPDCEERVFLWDEYHQALICDSGKAPFSLIFGENSQIKRRWRYFRKLGWLKKNGLVLKAKLPADSIIFLRQNKQGIVVLSQEKNMALKLFQEPKSHPYLNDEIATLKLLKDSAFASYTPKYLSDGMTSNGGKWLTTEFTKNTLALTNMHHPEKFLFAEINSIMGPMAEFYKMFSPQVLPISNWINQAEKLLAAHPSRNQMIKAFEKLKAEANKFPDYVIVEGRIHHDLHAGNLLATTEKISIIDWEGSTRSLVLIDMMDFYRRYIQSAAFERCHFHAFLKQKRATPPKSFQVIFQYYQTWAKNHFQVNIPNDSERLTFLIYVFERVLLLQQKRQFNLMNDHAGLEYKVLAE